MRFRSVLLLAIPMLLAAGCGLTGSGQAVVGENGVGVAEPGVAGPGMPFPECQTAELAFAGESTLAAIGLGDFAAGPDANKVGMIWVTAGPPALAQPMPVGEGKDGIPVADARWVCVQWPDGSGMAGSIPDEWVPPATLTGSTASDEAAAGVPIGVLALVIGAAVLIGVSVLAFRHEGA